jgi:hypothetical protein
MKNVEEQQQCIALINKSYHSHVDDFGFFVCARMRAAYMFQKIMCHI